MSRLSAVAVIVGAVPPLQSTPVKVAVKVLPCFRISVIDAPAVAAGMVNVQFPFSVTVWTLPVVSASVVDVPLLPIAEVCSKTTGSRAAASVPLVICDAAMLIASLPPLACVDACGASNAETSRHTLPVHE
jgi:hypothetical protein